MDNTRRSLLTGLMALPVFACQPELAAAHGRHDDRDNRRDRDDEYDRDYGHGGDRRDFYEDRVEAHFLRELDREFILIDARQFPKRYRRNPITRAFASTWATSVCEGSPRRVARELAREFARHNRGAQSIVFFGLTANERWGEVRFKVRYFALD